MSFPLRLIPAAAAAFVLASCGGGGAVYDNNGPTVTPTSGVAVDGYLSGSTVLCDTNGNGSYDAGEVTALTDAAGEFKFPQGCTAALVAKGGTNIDTGLPFVGVMKAPANATVITPLTTLIAAGIAPTTLLAALGLPPGTDLLNTDPVAESEKVGGSADLLKATLVVQQLMQKTAELFQGLAPATGTDAAKAASLQSTYAEVATAFASALTTSTAPLVDANGDIAVAVVNTLVAAAAEETSGSGSTASAEVKAALSAIAPADLADTTAAGLTAQANTILQADVANLTTVTTAAQSDTTVTTFVQSVEADLAAGTLDTTAAAEQLASTVVVAVAPVATHYLAIAGDAISLVDGGTATAYTMTQFQSAAGISVKWPLASTTNLRVTLAETGTYAIPAGQKISAAVAISETTPSGQGELKAYIENVDVSRTANGLVVTVPTGGVAYGYGVSSAGDSKLTVDFNSVSGVTNTLTMATNNILFGEVVNFAINQLSNDFTGIYSLRGKYKVSIVLNGVPLRKADGTALPVVAVSVPTTLNSSGAVVSSKLVSGPGLTGYITLTN